MKRKFLVLLAMSLMVLFVGNGRVFAEGDKEVVGLSDSLMSFIEYISWKEGPIVESDLEGVYLLPSSYEIYNEDTDELEVVFIDDFKGVSRLKNLSQITINIDENQPLIKNFGEIAFLDEMPEIIFDIGYINLPGGTNENKIWTDQQLSNPEVSQKNQDLILDILLGIEWPLDVDLDSKCLTITFNSPFQFYDYSFLLDLNSYPVSLDIDRLGYEAPKGYSVVPKIINKDGKSQYYIEIDNPSTMVTVNDDGEFVLDDGSNFETVVSASYILDSYPDTFRILIEYDSGELFDLERGDKDGKFKKIHIYADEVDYLAFMEDAIKDDERFGGKVASYEGSNRRIIRVSTLKFSRGSDRLNLGDAYDIYLDDMPDVVDVFFESNGGSDVDAIENLEVGSLVERPTDPVYPGFEFVGWFSDLSLDTLWNFEADEVVETMTLYAKWTPIIEHTVYFESFGGTEIDPLLNVIDGGVITEPKEPVKDGYQFMGWFKEKTYENEWDFFYDHVLNTMTLYAKWDKVETPIVDVEDKPIVEDKPVIEDDKITESLPSTGVFDNNIYLISSLLLILSGIVFVKKYLEELDLY